MSLHSSFLYLICHTPLSTTTNALQSLNKTLHTSQALSAASHRTRLVQLITTEWRGAILFHTDWEEEFLSDRINELVWIQLIPWRSRHHVFPKLRCKPITHKMWKLRRLSS